MASLGLYAVAGLFWVPVIFMQIEMRDLARIAAEKDQPLPPRYPRAVPPLVSVRYSRLRFGHGHSLADDRKALLGKMDADTRRILVLGASGLIGGFVTRRSSRARISCGRGRTQILAVAENNALDLELQVMSMEAAALARLLRDHHIDVVIAGLGVLQDGPGSDTAVVHRDFVARLLQAIRDSERAIRLVHIWIPGTTETDRTAFSTTKREAERLIAESGVRSRSCGRISWWRLRLMAAAPWCARSRRFRSNCRTPNGPRHSSRSPWRILPRPSPGLPRTLPTGERRDMGPDAGGAGHARRRHRSIPPVFGGTAPRRQRQPRALDDHRHRAEDPCADGRATPGDHSEQMVCPPVPNKALVIASLVLFWVVSGLIALVISYHDAAGILSSHGFSPSLVAPSQQAPA